MLKIYHIARAPSGVAQGYVTEQDYFSLAAALREALEGWEHAEAVADLDEYERIAKLRKQFLES